MDGVVEQVGGGSLIKRPTPSSFCKISIPHRLGTYSTCITSPATSGPLQISANLLPKVLGCKKHVLTICSQPPQELKALV